MYMKSADSYIFVTLKVIKNVDFGRPCLVLGSYIIQSNLLCPWSDVNDKFSNVNNMKSCDCWRNCECNYHKNSLFGLQMNENNEKNGHNKKFKVSSDVMRIFHANISESKPVMNHQNVSPPCYFAHFWVVNNSTVPLRSTSKKW